MATLDSSTRADLQGDLGIGTDEEVFTDAELDRHYTRTEADYEQTVALALRQLVQRGRKFEAFTAGLSTEEAEAVHRALEAQLQRWERLSGLSGGRLSSGVIDLGIDADEETV
jgi:hypothetical protein